MSVGFKLKTPAVWLDRATASMHVRTHMLGSQDPRLAKGAYRGYPLFLCLAQAPGDMGRMEALTVNGWLSLNHSVLNKNCDFQKANLSPFLDKLLKH